jgi:hypothetical protein
MKVSHCKPRGELLAGSFEDEACCYRSEVTNTNDVPIKVVWFEAYACHHDNWYGWNISNRTLLHEDFIKWYAEGDAYEDGWLMPGKIAACDPNWSGGSPDCFPQLKWSFLAVDRDGNTYFDEAEVTLEAVTHVKRGGQ